MFNHHVRAALARERASEWQAKAQAARWARASRSGRRADLPGADPPGADLPGADLPGADLPGADLPGADLPIAPAQPMLAAAAAEGTPVVLRDGSTVLIRQVRGSDAPLLADGFARLSARSRQMRFLSPKTTLSAAELRYLTEIDHDDHEALGALSPADGRGVGVARYIRDRDDPRAAEIAVTIADDWQGRGLGGELLARLTDRARQAGICRFTATVSADNVAMTGLLWKMGAKQSGRGLGTVEYEVALDSAGEYSLDWWFRCVDDNRVLAWP